MPYIKSAERKRFDPLLKELLAHIKHEDASIGDINYAITKLLIAYLKQKEVNYQRLNEVLGVLECVKQEFYRRVVAPYEDQKKKERGDVY